MTRILFWTKTLACNSLHFFFFLKGVGWMEMFLEDFLLNYLYIKGNREMPCYIASQIKGSRKKRELHVMERYFLQMA